MKTSFDVEGLKELDMALGALGNAVGTRVLRSSTRTALKPMVEKAKSNVSYNQNDDNDYHLKDSIKIFTVPKKQRKAPVEFYIGAGRKVATSGKRRIVGGLGTSIRSPNYARIIEKSRPWLLPAFDTEYRGFVSGLKTILAKRIATAAKKQGRS